MSDIVILLPSMDLTPAFARTQDQKENSLEGQMLQRGLFKGLKWSLCQLVQHQGEVPGGMPIRHLGLSLWKLSRRRVRFSSLLTLIGELPNCQQWLICSHQWYLAVTS